MPARGDSRAHTDQTTMYDDTPDDTDPNLNDDAPHGDWIGGQLSDVLTEATEAKGMSTMEALAAIDAWSDVERFDHIRGDNAVTDDAAKEVMTSMELAKLRGRAIFAPAPTDALEAVIEEAPPGPSIEGVADGLTDGADPTVDITDALPSGVDPDDALPSDIDTEQLPDGVQVLRLDADEHPGLADRILRDLRDVADVTDDAEAADE